MREGLERFEERHLKDVPEAYRTGRGSQSTKIPGRRRRLRGVRQRKVPDRRRGLRPGQLRNDLGRRLFPLFSFPGRPHAPQVSPNLASTRLFRQKELKTSTRRCGHLRRQLKERPQRPESILSLSPETSKSPPTQHLLARRHIAPALLYTPEHYGPALHDIAPSLLSTAPRLVASFRLKAPPAHRCQPRDVYSLNATGKTETASTFSSTKRRRRPCEDPRRENPINFWEWNPLCGSGTTDWNSYSRAMSTTTEDVLMSS